MEQNSILRWTGALTAILLFGGIAATPAAQAAVILTLDNTATTTIYQQTSNSPCVIGDPSCSNPGGFGSTTIPGGPSGDNYTLNSPTYTVGQVRAIVGDQFLVGIDVNTTTQPLSTERLLSFSATIGGVLAYQYTGNVQFLVNNNGNGFSDALLRSFDLTGLAAGTPIFFTASIQNATDGREEFFLVSGGSTPVPEPASLAILGAGLMGLAMSLRRKGTKTLAG
jgi:hypothetical protein